MFIGYHINPILFLSFLLCCFFSLIISLTSAEIISNWELKKKYLKFYIGNDLLVDQQINVFNIFKKNSTYNFNEMQKLKF